MIADWHRKQFRVLLYNMSLIISRKTEESAPNDSSQLKRELMQSGSHRCVSNRAKRR